MIQVWEHEDPVAAAERIAAVDTPTPDHARSRYPRGVGASTLAIDTTEHDDNGIRPDEVITVRYHLLWPSPFVPLVRRHRVNPLPWLHV